MLREKWALLNTRTSHNIMSRTCHARTNIPEVEIEVWVSRGNCPSLPSSCGYELIDMAAAAPAPIRSSTLLRVPPHSHIRYITCFTSTGKKEMLDGLLGDTFNFSSCPGYTIVCWSSSSFWHGWPPKLLEIIGCLR